MFCYVHVMSGDECIMSVEIRAPQLLPPQLQLTFTAYIYYRVDSLLGSTGMTTAHVTPIRILWM